MCQPDTGAPARATLFVGHFVNHLVPNEGGGEAEGHAAAAAFVGLFPTVHDVVLDQVGMVVEGLVVLGAHVRVHPGVCVPVQHEL